MTEHCAHCGNLWRSGMHECTAPLVSAVHACARCNRPLWDRAGSISDPCACGETLTIVCRAVQAVPDPPIDRMFIARLAALLGGVSYATAREWMIAKASVFRGMGEADFAALIRD